jgi:oxygen-independent coproporphyrinogen-3 oxidase
MQSFHDGELAGLGRMHSSGQSRAVFSEARRAGFANISVDLMYGLAGQTVAGWEHSLEQALGLQPEHISIYQLSVEEGTGLFRRMQSGSLTLPPEDEILVMDEITREICAQNGYEHYEISNFSKPGHRCRHNLVYWRNEEYLGCGAGAVSYLGSTRAKRIADPQAYCDRMTRGQSVIEESEMLDSLDSFRESVVLGLRLLEGVSEARLVKRFGFTFAEVYTTTLDRLVAQGLLQTDASFLRLTARGRRFANVVMAELV